MKFFRFSYWSKTDKHVSRGSPVKDKPANGSWIADVALMSRWSRSRSSTNFTDYGNREEAFFDSRPWLDSDCEDDFYSVNGDFTPSRGSTPCLSRTTSEKISSASLTDPSTTEKNKRSLLELLRDSGQYDHSSDGQSTLVNRERGNSDGEHKSTVHGLPPKSIDVQAADGDSSTAIQDKSLKAVQCCLPGLVSCRSFRERRKKASPVIAVDGKSLVAKRPCCPIPEVHETPLVHPIHLPTP